MLYILRQVDCFPCWPCFRSVQCGDVHTSPSRRWICHKTRLHTLPLWRHSWLSHPSGWWGSSLRWHRGCDASACRWNHRRAAEDICETAPSRIRLGEGTSWRRSKQHTVTHVHVPTFGHGHAPIARRDVGRTKSFSRKWNRARDLDGLCWQRGECLHYTQQQQHH